MSQPPSGLFPATDWKRLDDLRLGDDLTKRDVLGELFGRYRRPILVYLRRRGFDADRAEDLVQDFFLYVIDEGLFEKADSERGRFRNLMLSALNHYAANAHRRDRAQIRRPPGGLIPAEAAAEAGLLDRFGADRKTPEDAFQQAWAHALIDRAISRLAFEFSGPRVAHFELFRRSVVDPVLEGSPVPPLRDLAHTYGLTEKEVSNRIITAKRAYRRLLRAEVEQYSRSSEETDAELQELLRAVAA